MLAICLLVHLEILLLFLAVLVTAALAQTSAPTTLVGPTSLALRLPMSDALHTALANRNHTQAIAELKAVDLDTLSGRQRSDHHFLLAWSLLRTDSKADAVELIEHVRANASAPADYRALTIGEIQLAADQPHAAAATFVDIDADSMLGPRAKLQLAAAHQAAGSTKAAIDLYADLAERPDPAEGNDIALWALAQRAGISNPKSKAWLKRLWVHYPLTASGRAAYQAAV